jgi:hypothetical protein
VRHHCETPPPGGVAVISGGKWRGSDGVIRRRSPGCCGRLR